MTHSKASLSKSYCVLPFIQQFVDTDKRILPCCIADRRRLGPEYKGTESFNSDYLKRIRYQMLTGGKPPACKPCWDKEIIRVSRSTCLLLNRILFLDCIKIQRYIFLVDIFSDVF